MVNGSTMETPRGVDVRGAQASGYDAVLTPAALTFIAELERVFRSRRAALLAARVRRQAELDGGARPAFLEATRSTRESDWTIAPVPRDLQDRRVEITGPPDRKMMINALNSGARAFMADLEDACAPTWHNLVRGQLNLRDAVRRTISFTARNGRNYRLNESIATLMVRPRGWHLDEKHLCIDGAPVSGALFDFGLYLFHNAAALLERGSGPYFYLPKLQSHHEAELWNDIFVMAQERLGLARGTIKATVLIEHLLATFEADEILHALRDHSAGLNCGRWDYIFSTIKTFRADPQHLLPDRACITMATPFMRAYADHVIRTCHRRGAHAMGGMAAQIPIKGDDAANTAAMAAVRADKEREARAGHDGTWIAHPGLAPIALAAFDAVMPDAHQIARPDSGRTATAEQLTAVPQGPITERGVRTNISVGVQYLAAWLGGNGCVPLHHLMEDAATAEISRAQLWQWIHHGAQLDDGRPLTAGLFRTWLAEERAAIATWPHGGAHAATACSLFEDMSTADTLEDFLTLPAYDHLD